MSKRVVQRHINKFSKHYIHLISFLILGFAVYAASLDNDFILKDRSLILDHQHIQNVTYLKLSRDYQADHFYMQSLSRISLWLNYKIGGADSYSFHLVNLSLHIINVCLLYWFLMIVLPLYVKNVKNEEVLLTKAWLISLIFLVHPLLGATVNYIAMRGILLASSFGLLGIIIYAKAIINNNSDRKKIRDRSKIYHVLSLMFVVLALFSDKMALCFPLLIIAFDFILQSKNSVNDWFKKSDKKVFPFVLLLVFSLFLIDYSSIFNSYLNEQGLEVGVVNYYLGYWSSFINLFKWVLAPIQLDPIINVTTVLKLSLNSILSLFLVFGVFTLFYKMWFVNRLICFGLIWVLLSYLLPHGVLPYKIRYPESYLYFNAMGCLILIFLFWQQFLSNKIKLYIPLLIIVVLSLLTLMRQESWQTEYSFISAVIKGAPNRHAKVYYDRGLILQKGGDHAQAIKDFEIAIKINKSNNRYHLAAHNSFSLGISLQQIGAFDRAVESYGKVLEVLPRHINGYLKRGNIYYRQNKFQNALKDYNIAITLNPNHSLAYNNRGSVLMDTGETGAALSDFNMAISLQPNYDRAYFNRGLLYELLGKQGLADENFKVALKLRPQSIEYSQKQQGVITNYKSLNKIEDTETMPDIKVASNVIVSADDKKLDHQNLENTIKIDMATASGQNKYGIVLLKQKQINQALIAFTKAVEIDAKFSEAYYNRGYVYQQLAQWDEAIDSFKMCLKFETKNEKALNNMAISYAKLGDSQEAIKIYKKLIKLNPQLSKAHYNLGSIYLTQGDFEEAIKSLATTLKLDPNYPNAKNKLELAQKNR
ncbi:hypothetical protein BVY03_00315 [bacterium K02(2017)]|nr:hypothetical protein BVY03_00315 [bacterium K02(2017)]